MKQERLEREENGPENKTCGRSCVVTRKRGERYSKRKSVCLHKKRERKITDEEEAVSKVQPRRRKQPGNSPFLVNDS
jgi:hypothetical protein